MALFGQDIHPGLMALLSPRFPGAATAVAAGLFFHPKEVNAKLVDTTLNVDSEGMILDVGLG